MKKQKRAKKIETEFTWYNQDLDDVIMELQNFRDTYPDKKFLVDMDIDYGYYPGEETARISVTER